jgi:hypothetical protein
MHSRVTERPSQGSRVALLAFRKPEVLNEANLGTLDTLASSTAAAIAPRGNSANGGDNAVTVANAVVEVRPRKGDGCMHPG